MPPPSRVLHAHFQPPAPRPRLPYPLTSPLPPQDAARVMGNTALFQLMQAASAAIKRDVIFAASLYVA